MDNNTLLNEKVQTVSSLNQLDQTVVTAGRILAWRNLGGLIFGKLADVHSSIQLVLKKDYTEDFDLCSKNIKKDYIVWVKGKTYNHQQKKQDKIIDNFSIAVEKIYLLHKPVKQLPDKHKGLRETEKCRRLKIIDYIVNRQSVQIITIRHKLIKFIRSYLDNLGLTEVETPILESVASGAAANPFKTFYDSQNRNLYLRIAPEFPLKKFIVAGFNGVYEIAKCFRNEGIDPTHLPEFTMLEFYIPYINYQRGREIIIQFLQACFKHIHDNLCTEHLDFSHIPQIDYKDFLEKYGLPRDIWSYTENQIRILSDELNFSHKQYANKQTIIDKLYKEKCLKNIINPVLVYNYPNKPLAKPNLLDKGFFQAFQVIIKGQECVNAYVEENDIKRLQNEFDYQENLSKNTQDKEIIRRDNSFLEIMSYGMAPTVGFGIGIDRLLSILTNQTSLRDCITFPLMKK